MTTIRKLTSFSKQQIRQLFNLARPVLKTPFFDLRAAPSEQEEGKILIVISRKIGNAVKRNKLRRRIKELFYTERGYAAGKDFILLAKSPEAASLSFAQLKELLQPAFNPQGS